MALFVAIALCVVAIPSVGAQDGSTEPSVPDLLVPADPGATTVPPVPDDGVVDTGPSVSTTVPAAGEIVSVDDGLAASTKVWIVIGALVGVAFLVLLLTILYWRRTKPSAVADRKAARVGPDEAVEGSGDDGAVPVPEPVDATAQAPIPPSQPAESPSSPASADPPTESPRPVGDDPPVDPRRSVFAPPPGEEAPPE